MTQIEKSSKLKEWVHTCTKDELIWINGYIDGLLTEKKNLVTKVCLLYATETGNSKLLALQLSTVAKKKGFSIKLTSIDQYKLTDLANETYVLIIISTHGEGEVPDAAKPFLAFLQQENRLLPKLKYSVLALGDTAYPLFCKAGEDVDELLNKAGAQRINPLTKCDVDYEVSAHNWFNNIIHTIEPSKVAAIPANTITKSKNHERVNYTGTIRTHINLNDRGSSKKTFHIEIASGDQVVYEAGDSLAVKPVNEITIVQKIIAISGANASTIIELAKNKGTIEELLLNHLNILYLNSNTVKKYGAIVQKEIPAIRIDLLDLLKLYPVESTNQFEEVLHILLPIAPRLYSIASSPTAHENEVHLTVASNRFKTTSGEQTGNCSRHLGELVVNSDIQFYIHKNNSFKLPAPDQPIIMIGPGTGIAPFRAFLAERDSINAIGKNWLFIGERNFITDFLYQTEIQQYKKTEVLTKVSLAFSRDQTEKIYVQHRILEEAEEFFQWMDTGSYVYIAGAKYGMSVEVEKTILQIIQEQSNRTYEEAVIYLQKMKQEKRYQKDVY